MATSVAGSPNGLMSPLAPYMSAEMFAISRLRVQHARQARRELARGQRLLQHLVRAGVISAAHDTLAQVPADQEDRDGAPDSAHLPDERRPRHSLHALVGEDGIE